MQVSEFVRHLAPSLFSAALLQLNEEAGIVGSILTEKWKAVTSQYSQATLRNSTLEYEVRCSFILGFLCKLIFTFAGLETTNGRNRTQDFAVSKSTEPIIEQCRSQ